MRPLRRRGHGDTLALITVQGAYFLMDDSREEEARSVVFVSSPQGGRGGCLAAT
jgi:hypothetical protein